MRWIESIKEAMARILHDLSKAVNKKPFWRSLICRVTMSLKLPGGTSHTHTEAHVHTHSRGHLIKYGKCTAHSGILRGKEAI